MAAHHIPPDLDEAFRRPIPPFGAASNTTERPTAAQLSGTRPEHPPAEDGNNKGVSTSRPLEEVIR